MVQAKWLAYSRLMRIDRPIGSLLLLWPTLWALWLAKRGVPAFSLLLIFIAGVFLMRSAGCVINDYADRHFDGAVQRTRHRPLATGQVSEKEAKYLFTFLLVCSFSLVLLLNSLTLFLSMIALALAWIYPFMKRFIQLPQVILGIAFGWSIPMAFAASSNALPLTCWLLLLANICWTVVYDTLYAMVDRDDDLKIGLKSTAILFGQYDKQIIALLQCCMLLLLIIIGVLNQLKWPYYWSLLLAAALFIYQQKLIIHRKREACFRAFINNNYVGLVLFIGIAFSF